LPKVDNPGALVQTVGHVTGYDGPRLTLLAVDDQPDQRQMLAALLRPLGFTVNEAASGSECLDSFNVDVPNAVLLDISMDEMDGWETARAIRDAGYVDLPIILVSANLFDNQPSKITGAQCQAFVGKPVLESELLRVLGQFLDIKWISAGLSGIAPPALPAQLESVLSNEMIPLELKGRLSSLLHMGHVQGLLDELEQFSAKYPGYRALCETLRSKVTQFEFHYLIELTRDKDHE
jgi:CheY-like chemotaxis protein